MRSWIPFFGYTVRGDDRKQIAAGDNFCNRKQFSKKCRALKQNQKMEGETKISPLIETNLAMSELAILFRVVFVMRNEVSFEVKAS